MDQNPNHRTEDFDLDDIVNEFKDYSPKPAADKDAAASNAPLRPSASTAPRSSQPAPSGSPKRSSGSSGGGKQILTGLLCLIAVAILVAGAYFGVQTLRNRKNNAETEAPATTVAPPEETQAQLETEVQVAPPVTNYPEPTNPVVDVEEYEPDQKLLDAISTNSQVVGLLNYGAYTSLFVTQANDNEFYLDHDYQLNSSWTGAPFLDYRCKVNPRSTNLIIHGHNMKNGTIFSDLINFYEQDYVDKYPIVSLAMKDRLENYVVFAVTDVEVDTTSSNYFKITEWDFDSDAAFQNYVGYMQNHSRFELPVDVQPGDKLLLLSTCNYIGSDGRLLICCRMLRDGETVDAIHQLFGTPEA